MASFYSTASIADSRGGQHMGNRVAGGGWGQWKMFSGISIWDVPMARRLQTAVSVLCPGTLSFSDHFSLPVNIPLHRRSCSPADWWHAVLQAVVVFCSGLFVSPACLFTTFLLLRNVYTCPLIAAYLIFALFFDKAPVTGSRKSVQTPSRSCRFGDLPDEAPITFT